MASRRKLTLRQRIIGQVRKLNHMTAAITVGGVGFYASYQHIYTVSTRYGQPSDIAALMPIAIDALMIVSGRYVTHSKSRLGKFYAVVGFVLSASASLAANVLAAPATWPSRVVAGWPAVCLVVAALVVHYGERKPRPAPRKPARTHTQRPVTPAAPAMPRPAVRRPMTLSDVTAEVPVVPLEIPGAPWDAPTQHQNRLAPLPR